MADRGPRGLLAAATAACFAVSTGACATTTPTPAAPPLDTPRPTPTLAQDAYVWQRAWTPAVRRAVLAHGPAFRRLLVLGAEVAWPSPGAAMRVARAQVDYAILRAAAAHAAEGGGRLEIGLALRVGPWRPAATDPAAAHAAAGRALAALAADLIARARAAGVQPAELNLDYDAPTAGLRAYAAWLRQLRPRLAGVPLTITALPAWLDAPDLPVLLDAADGWVLQVHSLERPRSPRDLPPLTDPAQARAWVARAARLSTTRSAARGPSHPLPLRVALPTYGYEVGFRPDGSFLGLRAEAPLFLRGLAHQRWPPGTLVRALRADAPALSALVRAWTRARAAGELPALVGLAWYRLPVRTDRLTWRWITLEAVMAGRPVAPRVGVALQEGPEQGTVDVVVTNTGLADAEPPARVVVAAGRAAPPPVVFAEALAGYTVEATTTPQGLPAWVFHRQAATAIQRLAPNDRRPVGWLRLATDATARALRAGLDLARPSLVPAPGVTHGD